MWIKSGIDAHSLGVTYEKRYWINQYNPRRRSLNTHMRVGVWGFRPPPPPTHPKTHVAGGVWGFKPPPPPAES